MATWFVVSEKVSPFHPKIEPSNEIERFGAIGGLAELRPCSTCSICSWRSPNSDSPGPRWADRPGWRQVRRQSSTPARPTVGGRLGYGGGPGKRQLVARGVSIYESSTMFT